MSLSAAACQYAAQYAPLLSALGAGGNERIQPECVPQGKTGDHVVFQALALPDIRALSGAYSQKHRSPLQVKVYAADQDRRRTIATTVRTMMRAWRGTWADEEIVEVNKDGVDFDGVEDPMDGSQGRDWFTLIRYAVWHRSTTEV